jgi:hypothetical protein
MHASECDCPPIDEWVTDPYEDETDEDTNTVLREQC